MTTLAEALAHDHLKADLVLSRFKAQDPEFSADTEVAHAYTVDGVHRFTYTDKDGNQHTQEVLAPVPPAPAEPEQQQ